MQAFTEDSPNLTNKARLKLREEQRRHYGTEADKKRDGMTRSRYRRMKRRGHEIYKPEEVDNAAQG